MGALTVNRVHSWFGFKGSHLIGEVDRLMNGMLTRRIPDTNDHFAIMNRARWQFPPLGLRHILSGDGRDQFWVAPLEDYIVQLERIEVRALGTQQVVPPAAVRMTEGRSIDFWQMLPPYATIRITALMLPQGIWDLNQIVPASHFEILWAHYGVSEAYKVMYEQGPLSDEQKMMELADVWKMRADDMKNDLLMSLGYGMMLGGGTEKKGGGK